MPKQLPPKHFVDSGGIYLGAFVGLDREDGYTDKEGKVIPSTIEQPRPTVPGAVEVPTPPAHGRDRWDGTQWVPHVKPPMDLETELAKRDPVIQALVELVPGGVDAVKAKVAAMPPRAIGVGNTP